LVPATLADTALKESGPPGLFAVAVDCNLIEGAPRRRRGDYYRL
jgi:hypothetical protein